MEVVLQRGQLEPIQVLLGQHVDGVVLGHRDQPGGARRTVARGSRATGAVSRACITVRWVMRSKSYFLSGRVDGTPENGPSLGWVVSWQNERFNSHSVTAWPGQFRVVADGQEFITATWLLTRESPPEEDLGINYLGKDVFSRNAPPKAWPGYVR